MPIELKFDGKILSVRPVRELLGMKAAGWSTEIILRLIELEIAKITRELPNYDGRKLMLAGLRTIQKQLLVENPHG